MHVPDRIRVLKQPEVYRFVRDRPIRVFIVEDEWLYREAVVGALSSSSEFELCGQNEDGDVALSSMLADPPDIALVGLELARTDGLELTRRIQAVLPDTKVVIFTVSHRPEDLRAALAAGASGFVVKRDTLSPEKLHEMLRIVAGGGTLLTSAAAREMLIEIANRGSEDSALEYGLTLRERDVLALLSSGSSNYEIAQELSITVQAVKNHLGSIYRKLEVSNRTSAALLTRQKGLVERRAEPPFSVASS